MSVLPFRPLLRPLSQGLALAALLAGMALMAFAAGLVLLLGIAVFPLIIGLVAARRRLRDDCAAMPAGAMSLAPRPTRP